MHLTKIKIAGFKSFVDPTTLVLPGKLIAVVGPNGCGKSNIIDAVTWVMGESSPKYLRGESLSDVIFNGSNARKPVGQASVELVFDNSDATIKGEYGKYAEISIKRILNRDSDSSYYLNGTRCRKRDIVDIFLGTGLGPRSYSIIGQNMISRIIEAKPDELRSYLEEAAGISKYKERRHETELRIQHTKDNLARVNDLCLELDKQLNHLKYQANVAEKYKTLKEQERVLRAELYAIQWKQLDSRMVDDTLNIQREETALEARNSELVGVDRDMEHLRHEKRVANDAFQEVQRRYYAVGNEITRIEQDILHHQERQAQWEGDLKQTESEWQTLRDEMEESEDQLKELETEITDVEPLIASARKAGEAAYQGLIHAEEEMQTWQTSWDEFNQVAAKSNQAAQVGKTNIQHLEQRITALHSRQEQLRNEQNNINLTELNKEIKNYSDQSNHMSQAVGALDQQLLAHQDELANLKLIQTDATNQLDKVRSELQRLRGQQASLEALQQTALGQRNNPATPWVTKYKLGQKPRLAQNIQVESGWEIAAEKVLGFCLQAICVNQFNEVVPYLNDFKTGNLCVFTATPSLPKTGKPKGATLLEKVKSTWPLESLLSGIYVAESFDEALKLCEQLEDNESVVTQEGIWLNRSWLKILREEDPAQGVFQREQELKQLAWRIETLQDEQKELEESIAANREKIKTLEKARDDLQRDYAHQKANLAQLSAQQKMKSERLIEVKTQAERLKQEYEQSVKQLTALQDELLQAQTAWKKAIDEVAKHTHQRDDLLKDKDRVREQVQHMRQESQQKKQAVHELEIRLQTAISQKASLHQGISRLQTQMAALNERKITLQSELTSMAPIDTLKKSLSRSLDKHVSIESELNASRVALETLELENTNLEGKRQTIERDINKIRNALETLRVEWQGLKVKAETLVEQIKETDFNLEDILKELKENCDAVEWQQKLEQITKRINRLGPINLVAIDEYATCLERKQYLDKQLEDLQAGLNTLEDAIAKIDKETKTRFKETFDLVNNRFQEMFPTIFGGGKAYLELNDENLLEAGVTVMACPPGKRNTSIYLLSGGEKSLTAIALIFSIFYLNPAPFCMLDEVDAALDDANVLRFTRLVKMMMDKTQFIYISHNKITIEMAEYMVGVTMNEPGVSRLVSVDMEKAINLAGA